MYTSKDAMPLHSRASYKSSIPPPVGSWFADPVPYPVAGLFGHSRLKRSYRLKGNTGEESPPLRFCLLTPMFRVYISEATGF